MRAREFLTEYNRQVTAQRFGNKIVQRTAHDRMVSNQLIASLTPEERARLIDNILQQLEAADPTPNKEYMPWIAKMYGEEGYGSSIEDMQSTTKDALAKFHALKSRRKLPTGVSPDIMYYKTVSQFLDVVDALPELDELDEPTDRGQAREIFRNEQVRIINPEDQAAACYYGRGTRWCTAARQNNYFNQYASDGPLYIMIPQAPEHPGEKYQVHWESGQFMNEKDQDVDPGWLITQRFGNLLPLFRRLVPDSGSWLVFNDDADIERLITKLQEQIRNHVMELISEWESSDDYYYKWLRDNDYVVPAGEPDEGDIDWERVEQDGVNWLDWNPDAKEFVNDIDLATEITPDEARDLGVDEFGIDVTMEYLPNVLARSIYNVFQRDRNAVWPLIEWIHDDLNVRDISGDAGPPQWAVVHTTRDKQGRVKYTPL